MHEVKTGGHYNTLDVGSGGVQEGRTKPVIDDMSAGAPKCYPAGGLEGMEPKGREPKATNFKAGASRGGVAESDSALADIGASIRTRMTGSGLSNKKVRYEGERIDIPNEGNLNSANQRLGG